MRTISIHLQPAQYKYLTFHFGHDPINLQSNRFLAKYLAYIIKVSDTPIPIGKGDILFQLPNRSFLANDTLDLRKGFPYITDQHQKEFNDIILAVMRREIFSKLDVLEERGENKRHSGQIKKTIIEWLELYDIEEGELSYECLKKGYQRYKKQGRSPVSLLL